MGIWSWLFGTPRLNIDTTRLGDHKLRALWAERTELTDEAREAIRAECIKRGLKLKGLRPRPRPDTSGPRAAKPAVVPARAAAASKPVEAPEAARNVPAILGEILDHHGGGLALATPTADVWIHGVPCRAGTRVAFHRNGRLGSATLARAHELEGVALVAGACVTFKTDGRLDSWQATLAADREFRVRAADADAVALPVIVPAGSSVTIQGGQPREIALGGPLSFDGWAFPSGTELVFGDSGALSHATCRDGLELLGIRWAAHETVVFEFGNLREGWPAEGGMYDGVPYAGGEIVRLHDNRRLARCFVSEVVRLSSVPCEEGTRIYVDDRGNLLEATLASDEVLDGVSVAAGSTIALEDGVPIAMTPRLDCELDGVWCASGNLVELTVAGRLVRATLARAHAFDGWHLPPGSVVVLDDGRLRRVIASDTTTPDGRKLVGAWRVELDDDCAIRMLLPTSQLGAAITLRESATVAGLVAGANTTVELLDERVRSLVLATDQRVGAWLGKGGTRVHFHPDGSVSNLYLAEDTTIGGVPCAAARKIGAIMNGVEHTYREEVRFDADGALSFATLATKATVRGAPLEAGHTIALYPNGALRIGTLATRSRHPLGFILRGGSVLGLFEDGSPSLATLDAPCALDGREHEPGTVLTFTAPGVLGSGEPTRVPLGPCDPITDD